MEERTADMPAQVDAMGRDKRRQVRGQVYGPTRLRIILRFVIFLAVGALLAVGAKIAIDRLDEPPKTTANEAPWARPDAPQREPKPIQ